MYVMLQNKKMPFRAYIFPVENTLKTILGRFSLHVPADQNYNNLQHCGLFSLIGTTYV